ncbi:leucine-rich repeat-containing protein 20 isoform X4 [Phalacrocorax aristotelis]|uniref:leucine-rich repeat-containing protein 20 isoform X4 n=1 Tax=Phalacrocorax aristotelis TaxID=126867 RepID=UPI003F4B0901
MPLPRGWSGWFLPAAVDPPGQSVSPAGPGARMQKRMGEAVARVARKVNDTVENKTDSLDLANCKLMTFPVGIYKAMRSVTEGIHHISLANNELKSLTSRFVTTFNQLRGFGVFLSPWLPSLPWRPSTWKRMRSQRYQRRSWPPWHRCGASTCGRTPSAPRCGCLSGPSSPSTSCCHRRSPSPKPERVSGCPAELSRGGTACESGLA